MSHDDKEESGVPWKLLFEVLKNAYKWPKAKAFGASILLVGPKGSGKSSVFHYLEKNKLKPESPHKSTAFAETSGWKPKFVGDNENYLEVSSFVDTKGQDAETAGADAIGMLKPSIIIVVLDGQEELDNNKKYLSEFISNVLETNQRVREKIKLIAIFLNKFDKSDNQAHFFSNVSQLVEQAKKVGGGVFGNKCIGCHTVLVRTEKYGTSLVEDAFSEIKKAIK